MGVHREVARSLTVFRRFAVRFIRFFSFLTASTASGDTAIFIALLNRSHSVSPGTFGAGSLFMRGGYYHAAAENRAGGAFPDIVTTPQ
jgi:hypothetical protein